MGGKVGLSMPKKERVRGSYLNTSCTSLAFPINLLYGKIDGCGTLMGNGYTTVVVVEVVMDREEQEDDFLCERERDLKKKGKVLFEAIIA